MSQEKPNSQLKPIVLVGGGTGGHIFPLVAIAEELSAQKIPFYFIGTEQGIEHRVVEQFGWKFYAISAGKWRRYITFSSIVNNFADVFRTIYGFFQALSLLRRTSAASVVSKGGFVSLPVVCAAKLLGKRIIVHESDTVMGLSNRIAAMFANRVLTAFEVETYPKRSNSYRHVGIPIRKTLRTAATLKAPKKSRPLILILPGSQGSHAINTLVKEKLQSLLEKADIVHLTGEKELPIFQEMKRSLPSSKRNQYKPYAFIDRELPYYFQTADLLVARSSATTIAEAALFKKAAYLIPLPTSASNHQVTNALLLERNKAAFVRQEYQLSPDIFAADIDTLLSDREKLTNMGERLFAYFNSNNVIPEIIKEIRSNG